MRLGLLRRGRSDADVACLRRARHLRRRRIRPASRDSYAEDGRERNAQRGRPPAGDGSRKHHPIVSGGGVGVKGSAQSAGAVSKSWIRAVTFVLSSSKDSLQLPTPCFDRLGMTGIRMQQRLYNSPGACRHGLFKACRRTTNGPAALGVGGWRRPARYDQAGKVLQEGNGGLPTLSTGLDRPPGCLLNSG